MIPVDSYTDISSLPETVLNQLEANVKCAVITPSISSYNEERRIFNRAIDKKPAAIVKCTDNAHVIETIRIARKYNLPVSIRASGHCVAGHALCDGIVVDLRLMKEIQLDPTRGTIRCGAGLTWGEFDSETQKFHLATTGGTVSTTGIAGLTLGGGIGWLMGKYGAACDNLVEAEVILADGERVIANPDMNSELFWGIRGGGGNFGVVTSFTYKLNHLGPVLAGSIIYPLRQASDVLRFFRAFTEEASDDLTCSITLLSNEMGRQLVSFDLCYSGDIDQGYLQIRPLLEMKGFLSNSLRVMSYCEFQRLYDNPLRAGMYSYWRANYLTAIKDRTIDTIIQQFSNVPSKNTLVMVEHFHGAMARVGPQETAFPNRDASYSVLIICNWLEPSQSGVNKKWTHDLYESLAIDSLRRAYVNYLDDEGEDRVRVSYGPLYERLVSLKNKYDPTNFFRFNHNVRPTVNSSQTEGRIK